MSEIPRLFCLDTVLIDVVLKVSALPERSGDVIVDERLVTTGGGFNAMSAAARHDISVVYVGRLGVGMFATLATRSLGYEGITAPVERNVQLDCGICVVLVEPDGERSFVTSPGAETTLRARDLETLGVRARDFVLVSGYNVMELGSADPVLEWVAHLGSDVTVFFDPATRVNEIPPLHLRLMMERADWLLCNAHEAAQLSGEVGVLDGAAVLASRRESLNVLVRNGKYGCVVALGDASVNEVAGFEVGVVDTNGAGDVHNGVFAAELAHGSPPLVAARHANAAAAMAIGRLGPATCPARAQVVAWMAARTN